MSEADIPGYEAGLPEVADLSNAAQSPEIGDEEGAVQALDEWQTVIPNAIYLEQLDQQVSCLEPTSEGVFVPIASPDLVNLVQELQQHNCTLQNRITQLETAIALGQNALQAEVEKSQQQEILLIQRHQEIAAAQTQINHLLQELEASQATAKRQQILIETLTAQLESSQERIAQLERDCALTQQRHHEQVQLLMQAENTCRDLQARLHRQQRHTLQFKAALEKCLEMPSMAQHDANVPDAVAENPVKRNTKAFAIQIFAPKTQPVQPWSTQSQFLPDDWENSEKLEPTPTIETIEPVLPLKEEQHPKREWQILQALGTPPLPDDSLESAEVSVNKPLPDHEVATGEQVINEVATEEVVEVDRPCPVESDGLGLSDLAFLETLDQQALLEHLPLLAPELERQIDRIVQSFMSEPSGHDDVLWEDLAHLIGLPLEPEELGSGAMEQPPHKEAEVVSSLEVERVAEAEIEESLPEAEPTAAQSASADSPESIETTEEVLHLFRSLRQTERQPNVSPDEVKPSSEQPSRFFTVAATLTSEVPDPDEMRDDRASNTQDPVLFQSQGPSPLVYPLRPNKKLKSLAAVQLPSFPRLQSVKG